MGRNRKRFKNAPAQQPATQPVPPPVLGDIGFTGINRLRGWISEEYLAELTGVRAIDNYTRMRGDGMIQAILTALMLPVIAASWVVEPAGQDRNSIRAADLVEDQLFEQLGDCWEDEVRSLLSYLIFGFGVNIKEWQIRNGALCLNELRPVHPKAIFQGGKRWEYAPDSGQLAGVWQYGSDGTRFREEFLPIEALVVLSHASDFKNPEGRSILRAAYKHWKIKDQLYLYGGIGAERGAVGVPVGKYPKQSSSDQQDTLQSAVEGIATQENAGITLPEGFTIENFQPKVDIATLDKLTVHHDTKIAQSVLAGWIMLGQDGNGGAYALSADQTDLFLLCLETIADYLAARINRAVIPQMVSYNIATDRFPKLSATISRTSATALANLISPLVNGVNPALTWGEADEDWLREYLQLPPRTEPRAPKVDPTVAGEDPETGQDAEDDSGQEMSRRGFHALQVFGNHPFDGEQPAYPALGKIIGQCKSAVVERGRELQRQVVRIAQLPDAPAQMSRRSSKLHRRQPVQRFNDAGAFEFGPEQDAALDDAIAQFIADLLGQRATLGDLNDPEAILPQFLRLGHATGANRAGEQLNASVTSLLTPDSPYLQRLYQDAFQRLSDGGRLRIGDQLADIKTILQRGAASGDSPLDVARELDARFSGYEKFEWERLARTEMASAANTGTLDEYREAGVDRYEWSVAGLACPICLSFAGQTFAVGDGPVPPEDSHPQCMCAIQPVVEEK